MLEIALSITAGAADTANAASVNPFAVFFWAAFVILFAMVVAYLSVRAGSIAYFRTKFEHYRSVLREGDRYHGEE